MAVDPAWVLALMLKAEPSAASSPWRATYEATADAFARAASARPLFDGPRGAEKTAALLVSTAWFESGFRQDAEGDFVRGAPTSFCALQVNASNFRALGVTREALTRDELDAEGRVARRAIDVCADAGLRMMRVSFGVCRGKPLERRMDHYARGGDGCLPPPHDEGTHRVKKALWLFERVPAPAAAPAPTRVGAAAAP